MTIVLLILSLLVLVLLPVALIQRCVITELERDAEKLIEQRDELRLACSDWQEIAEQQADELKALKGPRPRRPARPN